MKKYRKIVLEIERKWRPLYQELINLYNILNIEHLFTRLNQLKREHKQVTEMIATILEQDGEGNQEEAAQEAIQPTKRRRLVASFCWRLS